MKGWLVVNGFIKSNKFDEIYGFLVNAAKLKNVDLIIKDTCFIANSFARNTIALDLPSFVIFWDKDIYLAQKLERLNIKVFNSSNSIKLCDNKILTFINLEGIVKMPKTIIAPKTFENVLYPTKDFIKNAFDVLKAPIIIKEAYGSFGKQVYLANSFDEAIKIIDSLGAKEFLMQEFISSSYGKDVRINVVGDNVVSTMLRQNDNDFRSNISSGGKWKKYEAPFEMKQMALKAVKALGLDYAGVDILFGKDGNPILCEVNSNPHFKSSYECTGIDMSLFIIDLILEKIK